MKSAFIGLSLFILLITGCNDSGDSSDTTTNSIIGTWAYTYPNSQCVETYTFNSNGTWSESSLDERMTGTYTFDETVNTGEKHAVTIVVTTDNLLADCNGESIDGTGDTGTIYATFPTSNTTEWYNLITDTTPTYTLTKQ